MGHSKNLYVILASSLLIVTTSFMPGSVSAFTEYRVKISFLDFRHEKLVMDDYKFFVEFEIPSIGHYQSEQTPEIRYASQLTPLEFNIEKSWLGLSAKLTVVAFWHLNDVIIDINPNRADGRWIPGVYFNEAAKKPSALVIQYTLGDPAKQISADGNDDGYLADLNNDAYVKLRIETLAPKGYFQCKAYRNGVDIGSDTIVEVWAPFPEGGHVLVANQTANTVIELTCGTYLVRVMYHYYVIEKNVTVAEDITTYEDFHWFDLIIEPTEGGETFGPSGAYPPGTYVFLEGETRTLSARAFKGYKFSHWVLDGQIIKTENPEITVAMNSQHTLRALFAEEGTQLWIVFAVAAVSLTAALLGILGYRRYRFKKRM